MMPLRSILLPDATGRNVSASGMTAGSVRAVQRLAKPTKTSPAAKTAPITAAALIAPAVRGLEERLGVRLLTRTTRSVSPTEAGERLLRTVGPRFEEIDAELEALSELRDKPAGTIRITAGDQCRQHDPLAEAREIGSAVSGHQGRDHPRLRADRHRRAAL
jgi:DNA-binding transcriptional LysR family regulator